MIKRNCYFSGPLIINKSRISVSRLENSVKSLLVMWKTTDDSLNSCWSFYRPYRRFLHDPTIGDNIVGHIEGAVGRRWQEHIENSHFYNTALLGGIDGGAPNEQRRLDPADTKIFQIIRRKFGQQVGLSSEYSKFLDPISTIWSNISIQSSSQMTSHKWHWATHE